MPYIAFTAHGGVNDARGGVNDARGGVNVARGCTAPSYNGGTSRMCMAEPAVRLSRKGVATMLGGRVPAAAFFDLDKTIIATSSTLAFSRPFFESGLITRKSVIRSMYAQLVYL